MTPAARAFEARIARAHAVVEEMTVADLMHRVEVAKANLARAVDLVGGHFDHTPIARVLEGETPEKRAAALTLLAAVLALGIGPEELNAAIARGLRA